jgi:hypothetical protein
MIYLTLPWANPPHLTWMTDRAHLTASQLRMKALIQLSVEALGSRMTDRRHLSSNQGPSLPRERVLFSHDSCRADHSTTQDH